MKRLRYAVFSVLLAMFGVIVPAPASAASTTNWWVHCMPVSGAVGTYDPITDPGSTETEHFHVFFGNTGINPNSTPASLQAAGTGATTCTTSTDTAAYWAPQPELLFGETQTYSPSNYACFTLDNGNQACSYTNIRAYYSTGGAARASLTNVPFGMSVIGGDHAATGPQPVSRVSWACGNSTPFEQYPYDCTPYLDPGSDADGVIARVNMPRCYNGLDPTNRANFAYPLGTDAFGGGACPAGFPKKLPQINVRFHTGIVTPCPGQVCPPGSKVTPSFGFRMADNSVMPWYDIHADFMDGWQRAPQDNPGGLDDLVQDCLIAALSCPSNPHTSPKSNMPT